MAAFSVPGILAQFLEERACVGCAATRDGALRPALHWIGSWSLSADRRDLRLGISAGHLGGLAEALAANGEVAATFEQIGPHETYQFKGTAPGVEAAAACDLALWEQQRARFAAGVRRFDPGTPYSELQLRNYIPRPEAAVVMRVREIYLQTPGPAAGRRLSPAGEPA